jgi:hypothetical protein
LAIAEEEVEEGGGEVVEEEVGAGMGAGVGHQGADQ